MLFISLRVGHAVAQSVEELQDGGLDSRLRVLRFFSDLIIPALRSIQLLAEMSTRGISCGFSTASAYG